ncbi:MAG: nitrate ABC transporter ATP-binding protein [Deltaproteobacteria bacterium RIFCSPLOWO2_12_FULL_57_22]|nr:MAG: nitrate ABC transporter ATP-binding protein [Deltaproteobacteria bacterium RIFCSPLOWO2_12_FULL_57_22]
MARDTLIACRRLCKSYHDIQQGERVVALDDLTLEISRGEFVTVIGPSGCGKTTLLNIVAGFERPDSGEILVENQPIQEPGADRGVVFQEYALFPWLTLRQNVEYGPRERGVPPAEAREIVERTLRLVSLQGAENRYPHELSGGMRQRAALARVLVNDPKILLMDEPFAAVDAQTRAALQREVAQLWAETGKTVLFITHSVEEAVLLGDRVVTMTTRPGRIKADVAVSLTRPRDPTSPAFNDYRRAIEQLLMDASAAPT